MNKRSLLALILALICAMTLSRHASAASITCTASNTTINFGAYPVLSGTVLDGVGSFTVTCVNSFASTATVTYTAKLPASSTLRQLAPPSGTDRLSYALYVDSARTQAWGDGSGGTFTISGTVTVARNSSVTDTAKTFYGRISPGGQDVSAVSPGPSPTTYSQALTITVTCTGSGSC
ncbi:MAG TPA: spore coat protein U domain-containing protein [Burkholderiales bacterium]|nr:spore coat protein U domain-containing protein [Burkholderiales bacterium]